MSRAGRRGRLRKVAPSPGRPSTHTLLPCFPTFPTVERAGEPSFEADQGALARPLQRASQPAARPRWHRGSTRQSGAAVLPTRTPADRPRAAWSAGAVPAPGPSRTPGRPFRDRLLPGPRRPRAPHPAPRPAPRSGSVLGLPTDHAPARPGYRGGRAPGPAGRDGGRAARSPRREVRDGPGGEQCDRVLQPRAPVRDALGRQQGQGELNAVDAAPGGPDVPHRPVLRRAG